MTESPGCARIMPSRHVGAARARAWPLDSAVTTGDTDRLGGFARAAAPAAASACSARVVESALGVSPP